MRQGSGRHWTRLLFPAYAVICGLLLVTSLFTEATARPLFIAMGLLVTTIGVALVLDLGGYAQRSARASTALRDRFPSLYPSFVTTPGYARICGVFAISIGILIVTGTLLQARTSRARRCSRIRTWIGPLGGSPGGEVPRGPDVPAPCC